MSLFPIEANNKNVPLEAAARHRIGITGGSQTWILRIRVYGTPVWRQLKAMPLPKFSDNGAASTHTCATARATAGSRTLLNWEREDNSVCYTCAVTVGSSANHIGGNGRAFARMHMCSHTRKCSRLPRGAHVAPMETCTYIHPYTHARFLQLYCPSVSAGHTSVHGNASNATGKLCPHITAHTWRGFDIAESLPIC